MGAGVGTVLFRCGACSFVTGIPTEPLSPEDRYTGYHGGPAPPSPDYRYHQWLARAEADGGPGRLLEVGAGIGGLVRVALERRWRVTATELSAPGLESLRRLGARVFAGDVRDARYPDATFDLVVALELFEHLPDPLAVLIELGRVTRPGGTLLASTPNFDGLSRRALGLRWRVIAAEHLGYFNRPSLRRAVEGAGYARLTVESRSFDMAGWRSLSGDLRRFDPQRAARLRDRVQERPALRVCRDVVNHVLNWTRLGDTLMVWARR